MLPQKITLTPYLRKKLQKIRINARRKDKRLRADWISQKIDKSPSWLYQIENGRLKTVKRNDLINVIWAINNPDRFVDGIPKNTALQFEIQQEFAMQVYDLEALVNESEYLYKENLIDSNGNPFGDKVDSFNESLIVLNGLQMAGRKLWSLITLIINASTEEVALRLKDFMDSIESIRDLINDALKIFDDNFNDEKSLRNLAALIRQYYNLYQSNVSKYCLVELPFDDNIIKLIEKKLDVDYVISQRTIKKSPDEYTEQEIDAFVKCYTAEDYMVWKNKKTYISDNVTQSPIMFKIKEADEFSPEKYITFDDISNITTNPITQFVLKQLYKHFSLFYYKYKSLLESYNELDESYTELENSMNDLLKNGLGDLQ